MSQFEQGLSRYLTPDRLAKIAKIKIGIAGAGGLGSNCAQMLVRTGFKHFKIIDFDVIDASNLNRQFYFMHQVGKSKVQALKENLRLINPDINIEAVQGKFEYNMTEDVFADCDAVVEAFDRAEYKKLIVETYINSGKLLVAASGLAGWGDSDSIIVRQLKENFYLIGDLTSAIGPECPPLAPRVHIAAAKQADVILSYFLR
ncbi:sulfur carrier protein ThiS adenylyltransferase ThiF [Sporomusa sp.]|uniref:sulfur carrier protein ThiS adenylyltransferase ThiF n=1 Tax=Sporomusa sp. TaxID=2078658 RepID=UPI002C0DBB82|nr:sulfur carrier protein ThiS adenylyltransferase ThiF [Sporomusa sp.]HWR43883.1 sulfur carrier protein ThiS adenylyltransferase ThiF [Sporomusa sp.]